LLAILGLPAFGVAFAYTVVGTYLPVLLADLSGPAVTGILIGGEGVVALIVPLLVGGWSDSARSGIGRRLPFVLAGAVLMVLALLGMPLGAGSLLWIAISLAVFFFGYFGYYTPTTRCSPISCHPRFAAGRRESRWFSFGGLAARAGRRGGFLLSLWRPLPFAIVPVAFAAVVLMTLPYTLLMKLLPDREAHGAGASLFGFAKGIGVLIGPLLAGLAITFSDRVPVGAFRATAGYAGVFGVAMVLLLASIPLLRRIEPAQR
jgi:Na+/melibiose symporter-like transporter